MHAISSEPVFASDVTLTANYMLVHLARRNGRHVSDTPPGGRRFISRNERRRAGPFCRLGQPDIVIFGMRGRILHGLAACQNPLTSSQLVQQASSMTPIIRALIGLTCVVVSQSQNGTEFRDPFDLLLASRAR